MSEAQPRYCTPRDPSRETDGGKVALISQALGRPLLPWQRLAADIAGEYDIEDGRRIYHYSRVVITVPRQAGKTTLDKAEHTRSLLLGPGRQGWYIAQRGSDAIAHFRKFVKEIEASPALAPLIDTVKYGAGDSVLRMKNGSEFRPSPPTDSSGHGFQGDRITIDEAWAFTSKQGTALLQAFVPTTITRLQLMGQQPQLWIMSTEGTADSGFLNPMLTECRQGLAPKGWAFIDYGLGLDDDPDDLDAVWRSHPGAGHLFNRRQLKGFRDEFKTDPAGWRRAFCNIRDDGTMERVYTADLWDETTDEWTPAPSDTLCLGVAVGIDQESTSIAISDRDPARVRILQTIPGTMHALDRIRELAARWDAPICIDRKGPAAPLADAMRRDPDAYRLLDMPDADLGKTGPAFIDMLRQGTIAHAPDPRLDHSVEIAVRRWAGDTWYLDRRQSPGDVSPIEAAQLAVWGTLHRPRRKPLQIW